MQINLKKFKVKPEAVAVIWFVFITVVAIILTL